MSDWSTGYNFVIGQGAFVGSYLYVPNRYSTFVSQTDSTTGIIVNSTWCSAVDAEACIQYDGHLYVTTGSTITQILLSDPNVINTTWATGVVASRGLAIYGTDLYVGTGSGGNVAKISLVGGSSDVTWRSGFSYPGALAIYGTDLYVANEGTQTIAKLSLVSETSDDIWFSGVQIRGLSVYGQNLYASGPSNIYQISLLNSSSFTPWLTIDSPRALVVYNNNLYISYDSTKIAKEALPDPPVPPLVCFKEGSQILTDKGYVCIQDLRKGDLVKTVKHGFMPIDMIGKRDIVHLALEERIKDQLYKCSESEYHELFEPLVITGCHAILVDEFVSQEQREQTNELLGDIFITDNKYRLPACLDTRTTVYKEAGACTIYHLALENDAYFANYGIYANGLLVETCSKRYLKELSNMELIE